jgi:hypothetical protein
MDHLCKYNNYIKEGAEDFKIGDEVIVNGNIDGRVFNNTKAIIRDKYGSSCLIEYKTGKTNRWNVPSYVLSHPEEETPVRTRWYHNGKLEEKLIKENNDFHFEMGDEVIVNGIVDERTFDNVEAKIIDIMNNGCDYINMDENGKCRSYHYNGITYCVEPINHRDGNGWYVSPYNLSYRNVKKELNDEPVRIRWYHKGKLSENKLNEASDEDIGRKVRMRDDSDYAIGSYHGYGHGEIVGIQSSDHAYLVKWSNGNIGGYRKKDLVFEADKPVRIRWYKNGKFEN